jgi:hypothetical protein
MAALVPTETLQKLLEYDFQFANTVANTSMIWWASSVVFCGYVLAYFWNSKAKIENWKSFRAVAVVIGLLFLSMIVYGWWIIRVLNSIEMEVHSITKELGIQKQYGQPAFAGIRWAIGIGTSSFAFVFIAWFVFCIDAWRSRRGKRVFLFRP